MDFLQPIFPDYVWVVGLSMMAFGLVMMILLRTWASRSVRRGMFRLGGSAVRRQ